MNLRHPGNVEQLVGAEHISGATKLTAGRTGLGHLCVELLRDLRLFRVRVVRLLRGSVRLLRLGLGRGGLRVLDLRLGPIPLRVLNPFGGGVRFWAHLFVWAVRFVVFCRADVAIGKLACRVVARLTELVRCLDGNWMRSITENLRYLSGSLLVSGDNPRIAHDIA